ncbi:formin-like protein 18 [Nicotiana sylvestris]|uniref:Formin-like protein n=1 Tax=Nicotiana sylvestris TaxID=4096 RepID=A0A1U7YNP8_NICSY|nr:PREDICTED: formin-like protein 18 [Nicotiana sylvestris]
MALLRKLFYRKPPDGLLEICERVYVFDCCFTTDVWEEENYKGYVGGVISQLRDHYPDVSILVFNFREGESQSPMANTLSEYDLTIMDYPRHYEGCPLLSMEVIHHFLRSSESWLSLGQQNVLLMHCERGGWPVLAFMLAALLIYRKHYTGEQKTLDMIYKQAPRELLYLLQPLNPIPSQLRYLQYVARRNVNMQWPPLDRALTLDCIIIRAIPNFDGEGGCRPIFRIYGQDPFLVSDRSPKILFSTPKKNKVVRHYKQAECELVKIDINCHIQGDVVLECICLHDDLEREQMMFRTMFNTAFVRSNILILNRDELDTLWDAKDQFPKDFRAEVLFSEMDTAASVLPVDLSCFEEKDGLPVEAFAKVQEIFNSVDWVSPKGAAARNVLQQITTSGLVQDKLESTPPQCTDTGMLLDQATLEKPGERKGHAPLDNNAKGSSLFMLEQQLVSSIKSSSNVDQSDQQKAESQFVGTRSEMKVSKLQPSIPLSKPSPADLSTESSASSESSQPSPRVLPTSGRPPLVKELDPHIQECGKLSDFPSLPETKSLPFKTSIPTSPPSSPLPGKDQGVGTGPSLSPPPVAALLTPPAKDKLVTATVPFASQATPPRTQGPPIESLKDRPTKSQPDTSLLHPTVQQPADEAAKMEPAPPPHCTGLSLSPPPVAPAPLTPPTKDKLVTGTVPSASPATPPRTEGPAIVSLKEDRPTMSQLDTSLLPVTMQQPADEAAKREPTPPPHPSGSCPPSVAPSPSSSSPSAAIPFIKPMEQKVIHRSNISPPPPPPPPPQRPTPILNESFAPVGGSPQPPAPPTPLLKEHSSFRGVSSPPPPPPPPPRDPYPLLTTPVLNKNSACSGGPLEPVPALKESLAFRDKPLPPPPPPPPPPPCQLTTAPILNANSGSINGPPQPPSTPPLKEKVVSSGGVPPPPCQLTTTPILNVNSASICGSPQPPPPPTPPLKGKVVSSGGVLPTPCQLTTTPILNANSASIGGSPQPPPPPTPPSKEKVVSQNGVPPPPPPPLPGQPMKENSSCSGGPSPPPPPPLPAAASKHTNISAVPLPPPPPALGSPQSVPSAPPPPFPSLKTDLKPGSGPTQSASKGSNLPTSPSPPPPSAPPPGLKGRGPLSRTMNSRSQSSKKLKPLHWLKISRAVSGSLWAEAQKCSDAPKAPEIDISELESLFSAAVPTSGQGGPGGKRNSRTSMGQKPEKVQLVDHRRAYNCEIMLSKVKIPLHDMLSSVLALEDSALDVDQVENLIKFCPTKEEMETLKGYKGEKEKLGRCEQFMLELMQVPRIESKLRVFSFKIQFESQVSELRKSLNIVNSAADQIKGSSKLKRIMQTILSLGNALNQGTARGSAVGFRLDSLLKLTETRARNNKMTLMHYLCKVLADKLPELLDFSKDLSSLEPAAKIQLKFLAEEMQAISKGLEKVVQELSMSENDGIVSENFRKALKEFLCHAEGEVRSLAQLYSGVGRNVDSLILYFGEDPARCPFEQVISTLLNFRRMFNQALEENRKQIEFERKKAEKEALENQKTSHSEKT